MVQLSNRQTAIVNIVCVTVLIFPVYGDLSFITGVPSAEITLKCKKIQAKRCA